MNQNKYQPKKAPVPFRLRPGERKIILLGGDILVSMMALVIALYFWGTNDWLNFSWEFIAERPPWWWFYFMPVLWILLNVELYDVRKASRLIDTLRGVAVATGVYSVLYLILYFTSEPNSLPRRGVAAFIVASLVLMVLWRFIYMRIFVGPELMRRVVIVGAGRSGSVLAGVVRSMWPPPFYLLGFIDDDPTKVGTLIEGYPVLGPSQDLLKIVEKEDVSDLVVAITNEMNSETFKSLLKAAEQGIDVETMFSVYEEILGRVPIQLLQSDWILRSFADQLKVSRFYEVTKRMLDVVGGLIGTAIFIGVCPFVSIATLIDSGAPIFYSQLRVGKNGRLYTIYKFRTMRQDSEKDGKPQVTVENDERITRVGRLMRKSHLDELPQFINILRGEMSLVGPRAERIELVDDLTNHIPFYRARLFVKPGLTGWAQVNFGYAATIEDTAIKLEYDLFYITHRDLLLDIVIILRTFGTVVGFRGQ